MKNASRLQELVKKNHHVTNPFPRFIFRCAFPSHKVGGALEILLNLIIRIGKWWSELLGILEVYREQLLNWNKTKTNPGNIYSRLIVVCGDSTWASRPWLPNHRTSKKRGTARSRLYFYNPQTTTAVLQLSRWQHFSSDTCVQFGLTTSRSIEKITQKGGFPVPRIPPAIKFSWVEAEHGFNNRNRMELRRRLAFKGRMPRTASGHPWRHPCCRAKGWLSWIYSS
jgi:hypothetical protein